jgi:hypothetical protein
MHLPRHNAEKLPQRAIGFQETVATALFAHRDAKMYRRGAMFI